MRDVEEALVQLGVATGEQARPDARERMARMLETERAFPQGYWHPEDFDGASEVMRGCLEQLGLDPELIPEPAVLEVVERHGGAEPESEARRAQLVDILARANHTLERAGSEERFWQFAEDLPFWEDGEPVWLLLTAAERARLLEAGIVSEVE